MSDFPVFAEALLSSLSDFLWSDPIKWIIGCVVLISLGHFICDFIYHSIFDNMDFTKR